MDRQRVKPPEGYHWEPFPLTHGRARLVLTDGLNIPDVW